MKRYIGVDLHTNSITVCYLQQEDKMYFATYTLTTEGLSDFKSSLRSNDELSVEATGNTDFFVDQVEPSVHRVVVVNPGKFAVIRQSVSKTEKNDARALAYFLSKDMLPTCRRKSPLERHIASLSQTRDKLVKSRTFFMNKIHSVLNSCGIKLKKESLGSKKGLARALAYDVDELPHFELEMLAKQVGSITDSIKEMDKRLVEAGKQLKGFETLASIKGIGEHSAAVLSSIIGNIDEFADESKLAAYLGMVPRVSNSNETTHHGRITKRGSKLVRTTLVQCTLIAIRYSEYLKRFYDRIKARHGSGKAIIATARKLLGIIYKGTVAHGDNR